MLQRLTIPICAFLFVLFTVGTVTAGIVILQVEVMPGFAIDVPENLIFPATAPGGISEQSLDVTVWANAPWILMARVLQDEGLVGAFEHRSLDDATWKTLGPTSTIVFQSSRATGAEGVELSIPFSFRVDYEDDPGDYNVEIELTVVPVT